MRYYGRGLRPKTVSNNHGGLTSFSDCATRSIGDYHEAILDEVAIEGLDGVTLEALWTRFLVHTVLSQYFTITITRLSGTIYLLY